MNFEMADSGDSGSVGTTQSDTSGSFIPMESAPSYGG